MGNWFEITIDYRFIIGKTKPTSYRLYTSPILNGKMQPTTVSTPEKERHLKGMEFVDLFLFICITLFYFDCKIVWENNTSNMLTYGIILKTGDVFLVLKKLKYKLKSCSKIYGCMDVVYLLKLHDNSGKTSYMYFGYQNRLQSIAAFYYP